MTQSFTRLGYGRRDGGGVVSPYDENNKKSCEFRGENFNSFVIDKNVMSNVMPN